MNKKWTRLISVMVASTMLMGVAGCSKATESETTQGEVKVEEKETNTSQETEKENKDQQEEAKVEEDGRNNSFPGLPEDTEATLKFAHFSDAQDFEGMIGEFNKFYPNITVEVEVSERYKQEDFLMTKAASGDLPDVFLGMPNLPLTTSQGWVYPLNDLIADDPEFDYVTPDVMQALTIGDEETIYALPYQVGMDVVAMNLDLLEELNLDAPEYDWDMDEFLEIAKATTTPETSGIKHFVGMEYRLMGILGGQTDVGYYGFDEKNMEFNLSDGTWSTIRKYMNEMRSIKGLIADEMIDQSLRDQGKMDDFQKKFGKDSNPWNENKILMVMTGTWGWSGYAHTPIEVDFYPFPAMPGEKLRASSHSHYAIMSSTTKNPEAALELMKFLTYSVEGNKTRLEFNKNEVFEEGDRAGEQKRMFHMPPTNHPDVIEVFNSIDYIPEGFKWLFENRGTDEFDLCRGDFDRDIPGFKETTKYLDEAFTKIDKGEATVEAIAKELEEKMNVEIKKLSDDLEIQREEAYKDFETLRAEIEGK